MLISPTGSGERLRIKQILAPTVHMWAKFMDGEEVTFTPVVVLALYVDQHGQDVITGIRYPTEFAPLWCSFEEDQHFIGYVTQLPDDADVIG